MTLNYGNGVSRTLTPEQRAFLTVVFQKGKPPLDAEMNLGQQAAIERLSEYLRTIMPSGWLTDPTQAASDFLTDPSWSNHFMLGNPASGEVSPVVWAHVNGWLVPVAGTVLSTEGDVRNQVRLYPPPASDTRFDLVFLEVWQAVVAANPSEANKPEASKVWKYGNVEFGQTNIDDDLVDGAIGRETTRRIQLQYRIRVFGQGAGLGSSVALDVYPDGLDDPNVLGQGSATTPVTGFQFTNMRETLGDAGLWRAGDGNPNNGLGTVDGRVYAIPICGVSRRNTSTFTAINLSGNPNNNGSFDRNPSAAFLADPREGAKTLGTATLTSFITATQTGDIQIDNLVDSGIDDPKLNLNNTFLVIGGEIIEISAVDSAASPGTVTIPSGGRGRGGTHFTRHEAGTVVSFYSARPDGLFADQVTASDLVDLRRSVNPGDWDYDRLLLHALASLAENRLRTSWKQSGTGDTQGMSVVEVDMLHADGSTAVPNQTDALDGPDGIRTVFSDAAALQTDVTLLLDNDAALTGGFTTDQFDSTVAWDVGADFKPSGFINNGGTTGSWTNGSVIFLHIGGDAGTEGARATFRDGAERAVRFVMPQEYWRELDPTAETGRQNPVTLRFLDQRALHPKAPGEELVDVDADSKHPGPMYPLRVTDFTRPFLVLGGLLHPTLKVAGLSSGGGPPGLVNGPSGPELDLGLDFDLLGGFYTLDTNGNFEDDPTAVTTPLLRGERTLFDMLTNDGRDGTGNSSQVYIVLYGDATNTANNAAFRVIGAGTVGYTDKDASNATSILLEPLTNGFTTFTIVGGESLTAEFRSQVSNVEDGGGFAANDPSLAIALTDISNEAGDLVSPWGQTVLGLGGSNDLSIPDTVGSKLQLNMTLLYHPGRGGMSRIPDDVWRVSLVQGGPTYLRQAVGTVDSTFPSQAGVPSQETFYDHAQVLLWNRLPSRGLTENSNPKAAEFGGRVVAFSEQDREHEAFLDRGSKTLILRPFQDRAMTVQALTTDASPSLLGSTTYPGAIPKDGAGIFTAGLKMGFPVPSEFMPRFGRQDIPFHVDVTGNGSGTFLNGINHLFTDSADPTQPVFHIIGGQDNTSGGNLVHPMYFQTGSTSGHAYSVYGTIAGPGTSAYQARLTSVIGTLTPEAVEITSRLTAVQSSDLGAGLEGIQLPPYQGIARIYGVYDRDDYIAKGGSTFEADRVTLATDPPTNLLRTDAKQQTLFIFQDGAKDLTLEDDDHTYIIPKELIDVTLSPFYNSGTKDQFSDFEYVVEAAVFGFAKGWINQNNLVLARLHNGQGTEILDGSDPELEQINMTIPSPAILNDRVYVGHNRTPYQGDPFMSREGETRTNTDYETRYGQVAVADAFFLNESIEQLDADGNSQVETPNVRALEVLSSVDFFTTLGTGKVGGELFRGTALDVGYTEDTLPAASRTPATQTQNTNRVLTRAFSEGQKENSNRAELVININSPSAVQAKGTVKVFTPIAADTLTLGGVVLTGVLGARTPGSDDFDVTGGGATAAADIVAAINDAANSFVATATAVANGSEVILTAVPAGVLGNAVTLVSSTAQMVASGSTLTGGETLSLVGATVTVEKLDGSVVTFTGVSAVPGPSTVDEFDAETSPTNAVAIRLADAMDNHPDLQFTLNAGPEGENIVLTALRTGARGNDLAVSWVPTSGGSGRALTLAVPFDGRGPFNEPRNARVTRANFSGGRDLVNNAGDGTTQLGLTGMIERLPLGILLQDSDFLGENPLNDTASAFQTSPAGLRPVQSVLPLTTGGQTFERFLGDPGQLVGLSDGGILRYEAFDSATSPTGTRRYRIYRGGGAIFVLSGENPGGPVDWVSDSFPASVLPVLKGGVLACKALLVRNYQEQAFATDNVVSEGDEIQMVIMTFGILGDGTAQQSGIQLDGVISPTGYGEGYAAADRYRLEGRPMFHGFSRTTPDPEQVTLAVFPGRDE
jgi:hypothetical protein